MPVERIVRIPEKFDKKCFSDARLRRHFSKPQWEHFRALVLAIIVTASRHNITGLSRVLGSAPHRTKRNDFVTIPRWDSAAVLRDVAKIRLEKLGVQPGETIYFIIDDSHARKRGKKMQGAGKYRDMSTQAFLWGHNFIVGGIGYRGQFIPYDLRLAMKTSWCKKLGREFKTLPDLAAAIIRSFSVAEDMGLKVVVLFDAGYMNKKVVGAVVEKGWTYVSALPSNRSIKVNGRWTHIKEYRKCIPKRQYRAVGIKTEDGTKTYWATSREFWLKSIGEVKVVFSQRHKGEKALPLVTNAVTLTQKEIIETYHLRWVIECFFKSGKQILGLAEYQTGKAEGIETHLRLVSAVYSLLVQAVEGWEPEKRAKRERGKKDLGPLSLMRLRDEARRVVFEDLLDFLEESADPKGVIRQLRKLARAG